MRHASDTEIAFTGWLAKIGASCGMQMLVAPKDGKPHYIFLFNEVPSPEDRRRMLRGLDRARTIFGGDWSWGLEEIAAKRPAHTVLWRRVRTG